MARVLFLGAPVESPRGDDIASRVAKTGHNTGNLLIGLSLFRELDVSTFASGTSHPHDFINENFDYVAIGASNFIYEQFDFGFYADYLEKLKLPVLMVGLGAQSANMSPASVQMPAGTLRFLKIVSDRCATIGVRGYFTADVLKRFGIRNVRVTGCPSLYYTRSPTIRIDARKWSDDFRISINGSQNVIRHAFDPKLAQQVELALLSIAIEHGYDYVLQNETHEIEAALNPSITLADCRNHLLGTLQRVGSTLPVETYFEFIRGHGRVFFSFEDWQDYIRRTNLSVGSRFHGNIIALICGIPALMFAHDSRTLEMCELMHIPHVPITMTTKVDLPRMYEAADYRAFERQYALLYRRYAEFLDENGADHLLQQGRALETGGRLQSYIHQADLAAAS